MVLVRRWRIVDAVPRVVSRDGGTRVVVSGAVTHLVSSQGPVRFTTYNVTLLLILVTES